MNNPLPDTFDHLAQDTEAISDDVQTLANDIARRTQTYATAAIKKALTSAKQGGQATDEFVHRNPWLVLAVVSLTTFVLGSLLNRQPRDRQ